MAKRTIKGAGSQLADAKIQDEAATILLKAAEKRQRAAAIAGDDDDDTDDQRPPLPTFTADDLRTDEPPLTNFEAALADLNGRGHFEVFKVTITGKRVKVGRYKLDEYPEQLETIALAHGGGEFRVILKNERGEYACSTTEEFSKESYKSDAPAAVAVAEAGATSMDRMMERMEVRDSEHRREIAELRLESQKMTLLMIEKMSAPRQETNLVDAIKLVKELQGEARSPMDSFKEVLELAASVREETGLAEPEHPMVAAIDKIMKVASPLLTAWASKVAAPSPASAKTAVVKALPASTGKPTDAPAVIPAKELAAPVLEEAAPAAVDPKLAEYANSLFLQADAKNDFRIVGDTIINLTGDAELDVLYNMVKDPAFVGTLLAADQRLLPHQAWLASLASYIKEEMDAAEADNAATDEGAEGPAAPDAVAEAPEEAQAPTEPVKEPVTA
jgi:hypothetical protein